MINVKGSRFIVAVAVCTAAILLQGCGAERSTPYSPDSSSSSSSVTSVTITELTEGESPRLVVDNIDKNIQVFHGRDAYFNIGDRYSNSLVEQDFTAGQVVLVDLGETDSCANRLVFSSVSAQTEGVNSVKLVISYSEKTAITSGCTSLITHPYRFYYIKSRGPLVVEENIR
jgi:uncharacterized protein YceK